MPNGPYWIGKSLLLSPWFIWCFLLGCYRIGELGGATVRSLRGRYPQLPFWGSSVSFYCSFTFPHMYVQWGQIGLHFLPLKTISASPLTLIFQSSFSFSLFYIKTWTSFALHPLFFSFSLFLSTLRLFLCPLCLSFFFFFFFFSSYLLFLYPSFLSFFSFSLFFSSLDSVPIASQTSSGWRACRAVSWITYHWRVSNALGAIIFHPKCASITLYTQLCRTYDRFLFIFSAWEPYLNWLIIFP